MLFLSCFLLCFCACLFIDAWWSPAGKGLTSWPDLGPNTLKSIQIHYSYFDLSMITITLQLQDL